MANVHGNTIQVPGKSLWLQSLTAFNSAQWSARRVSVLENVEESLSPGVTFKQSRFLGKNQTHVYSYSQLKKRKKKERKDGRKEGRKEKLHNALKSKPY